MFRAFFPQLIRRSILRMYPVLSMPGKPGWGQNLVAQPLLAAWF
jgi:hypothetical protein